MANMRDMAANHVGRIAAVGFPGSGKSGGIASVVNTGKYNLRVMDLDGNTEPLFQYIHKEHWGKVDIERVEERLFLPNATSETPEGKLVSAKQIGMVSPKSPKAFRRIWKLLEDWPGLGPVTGWGPQDILMIDSASAIIQAVERKVKYISGTGTNEQDMRDQGAVNKDFMALFERLKSREMTPCHLYVTFHKKLFTPEMINDKSKKAEPQMNQEIKEKMAELTPTKFFPNAPGRQVPPLIGGYFSTLLLFENVSKGAEEVRIIRTRPTHDMDVKLPGGLKKDGTPVVDAILPLATGVRTVFEALDTVGEDA